MTLALIDGDILIYKAAAGAEKEFRFPDGEWTYSAREDDGLEILNERISSILEETEAEDYILCFSDDINNFRKNIYPEYKNNRVGNRKPLLLAFLRTHCLAKLPTAQYPNLEADDVMGILATSEDLEGEKIIVTVDKDLMQIPVTVYNPDTKEFHKPEDREHETIVLMQTLTGDTVDGYPGCPGMGLTTAEELLSDPTEWEEYEHIFKSGPRKGQKVKRWRKGKKCTPWQAIVSAYAKAGLGEDFALSQARCAHILQAENYSVDGTIKLWEPHYE